VVWFQKRTPEQEAAEAKASEEFWAEWHKRYSPTPEERTRREAEERADHARRAFAESPAGYARAAFDRGDLVLEMMLMAGNDLNAISRQGWELLTGNVVAHYAEPGMALCHYLFKRCEQHRTG
jgi:hypothetical protein